MTRNGIKVTAIGIALLVFAVLYFSLTVFTQMMGSRITSPGMFLLINAIALFVWIIPGYLAARLAKTRGALNGAIVGVGATLLEGVDYLFSSSGLAHTFREHWYLFLVYGIVLSGLGGLLWDIKTMIKTRRSRS